MSLFLENYLKFENMFKLIVMISIILFILRVKNGISTIKHSKISYIFNDVIFNIISQFHIIFKNTHNLIILHNFLFSIPCSHKKWNYLHTFSCIYSTELTVLCGYMIVYPLCETSVEHPTTFVEASQKRRSSMELRNNISEKRCELKANEPVNERSE